MGQINRIPNGYLDLVGTETGGRNPEQAPEVVSPTLRMNEFYSSQTLAVRNFATNSLNIGDANTFDVPADEVWIMYSASFGTNSPLAGDTDVIGMFFDRLPRNDAGAAPPCVFVGRLVAIAAASDPHDAILFPVPLVLPHGARVRIEVIDRAGGAANRVVNCTMMIGRLTG